ncbi:4-amino-4-deoxy-L-arabinose transferase [Nocardioides gilvus]|uniref:4-amino-4-deoxy-L-arabinose transferase n=1 Tax=Nocardioides gilvus TaxID=1735589 RepID=UPI001EF4C8DA|nr:4-amino-4-deoxy-L-arabinose transferase [Nocardioides gilvus]
MAALPSPEPSRGVVDRVLALVDSRPASLGTARLLCIDGPTGSGKSTLADSLVAARPDTGLVRLDDLLDGWDGLLEVADTLTRDVLVPLSQGLVGSYRRYDWLAGEFAETVLVPHHPLLVVEGVGSGSLVTAPLRSALVWLEAPAVLRRRRGIARDGDAFAPHWARWAAQEEQLFATQRTRSAADLVIGTFA